MNNRSMLKKIIISVFSMCILLGSLSLCFAEETVHPKLEITIPPISKTQDTHAANTPQWGDELQAVVTYDKTAYNSQPVITWYRFNNHPKYDEHNNKIADTYYEAIHTGPSYLVTADDIDHVLKVETEINGKTLSLETNPVEKRNYGEIRLKVVDNTNYGDTDGYIGYLDTRMQFTGDDINIFDVENDGAVLLSGTTSETLNPNGYSWKVRYKGTRVVKESEWFVFTIKPGYKTPLESAEINLISRTLTPNEPEYKLKTTITPDNAYIGSISYKSSDEKVATVSADGMIRAVNNGKATITVTVTGKDNAFTKECEITVKNFDVISEAVIEEDNICLELQSNESTQLTASVFPKTAGGYTTTWHSSDESVCTVDSRGIVKAVSEGNAVITFSAVQGDISVMDTATVEVVPAPSVSSPDEWIRGSRKDLVFEFDGCTPDENTVVSITCENGRSETVYKGNYRIEGNKIIISYEYLKYMPLGNNTFSFEFADDEQNASEEDTEENNPDAPIITAASYTSFGDGIIAKASRIISYAMIRQVSDDNLSDPSENTAPESGTGKKVLTANILFASDPTPEEVRLEPGKTIFNGGITESGSFTLEKESGYDTYFEVDEHLSDPNPYFLVKSKGNNTSKKYTFTLKKDGNPVNIWKIEAGDFIDFDGVDLTLDPTAEIWSDSKSTCIITPAFSDGRIIDAAFLKGYEISFMEVSATDKEHPYSEGPYYFKQDSLKLDNNDFKLHAVANREGTGYIRGILSLKMTEGPGKDVTLKEIKKSANATSVSIELYKDVTTSNRYHLWSQNSSVNLTYTIQGDYARFLSEYGTFSDATLRLWYKKGAVYYPLLMSDGQFFVEIINESLINISINYQVLRRLYLGSYPLYISFKYDGSDFNLGPWNGNTWSRNGNYVLTTFTIIRSGIPIVGDAFKPEIWAGLAVAAVSVSAVIVCVLKKKKKRR